ncbi:hypothetical protein [Nostoc sp. MS1]|nr:hypothetical protein [Nostoc sp. MS1]
MLTSSGFWCCNAYPTDTENFTATPREIKPDVRSITTFCLIRL